MFAAYKRWKLRFGKHGYRGWFIWQWRRLRGFRPDYRMVPPPREPGTELPTGEMWGAVSGEGRVHTEWGPPVCFDEEHLERLRFLREERIRYYRSLPDGGGDRHNHVGPDREERGR